MAELAAYTASEALPPEVDPQIRTLLDAEWPGASGNAGSPLIDPDLNPMYFVLSSGDEVVGYARTIWAWGVHKGQATKVYGLGDVVTRPRWRRQGFGRRVVEAATRHIRADADADLAVLLTEPKLEKLYAESGWVHVPGMRLVTGERNGASTTGDFVMMLFLSAAARRDRDSYSHAPLILAGDEW
jgi:GNAT superfamily N-acetyltransferase